MNEILKVISEAVEGLESQAAESIRAALKEIEEHLEILEFKLMRSEKIKRTTTIFLEESVTELEEKRKAVEEVNDALEESLRELKATQEQLIQQEKMASLGALTAGIAHEIKNPLNFVNNFSEVGAEMADELSEAISKGDSKSAQSILAELKGNALQITKHGRRADDIVRSMMQYARGGESEREEVAINVFLEEYANLAWHGMRAREHGFEAEIIRDYDAEAGSISVYPQDLGRVILNLLNNSFDALRATE